MITSSATPPKKHSWGVFACIGVVLIASAILLFYKLGTEPLQDYDEATYARVTTESLASHDYLTYTYGGRNYFDKPPLLFWLMDVSKSVVGDTELGNRLPSALSAFVLVLAVMIIVYGVTQNGYAAALAGGVLATTSAFIEPARQVRFDILVSLFITLSVYTFLKAFEDRRWFLWYGVFIGLTVLAKGPLVLFAIVPSLAIAGTYRSWTWPKDKYFWYAVGISLLVALPWHVYETVLFGKSFWDVYLDGQVIDRVQQVLFTLQPTNGEYIKYFFEFALPWSQALILSVLATPFVWKGMSRNVRALLVASYTGVASVFIVCFATQTKAFSYLIPLYSFMAIACALVLFQIAQVKNRQTKVFAIALSAFLLLSGACMSVFNGFHINAYFAAEVSLAEQERDIGQLFKSQKATVFYTYNTDTIGSIMYYSQILSPIQISKGAKLSTGSLILYQTADEQKMQTMYSNETVVYRGSVLSVSRVES